MIQVEKWICDEVKGVAECSWEFGGVFLVAYCQHGGSYTLEKAKHYDISMNTRNVCIKRSEGYFEFRPSVYPYTQSICASSCV